VLVTQGPLTISEQGQLFKRASLRGVGRKEGGEVFEAGSRWLITWDLALQTTAVHGRPQALATPSYDTASGLRLTALMYQAQQ